MSRWPIKPLLDTVDLMATRVGAFTGQRLYVSTGDVKENGIAATVPVTFDDRPSRADLVAQEEYVLFARMQATNKVIIVTKENKDHLWSTGFAALRPRQGTNTRWLAYWLASPFFNTRKDALCTGATQKAITNDSIRELEIPFPPPIEQERLARILDEANALRRLRAETDKRTSRLIEAIFHEMFSTAEASANQWPITSLDKLSSGIISGATPATENPDFWTGPIPWISPKDMKTIEIFDSIDHVSESALKASRLRLLPNNTIIFVVRGMILAHSFPVAITRVPLTINQDMKAMLPSDDVLPEYLLWLLISNRPRILAMVSTAGHGTKRLEIEAVLQLHVAKPLKPIQEIFAARIAEICELEKMQATSRQRLDDLFLSLLNHAFRGEI